MAYFKQIRRLSYLAVVMIFAFIEMGRSGLVRRTFEFSTFDGARPVVEDRMLHKAASQEDNVKAYVEELILGPVSVDLAPLVAKGTTLQSFMLRDGTVYAGFSRDAVLAVPGGRSLLDSFITLNRGIRRNFPSVSGVRLFINGNEVFFDEFAGIFGAD